MMGKMDDQRVLERGNLGWLCGVLFPHPNLCTPYSLCLKEPLASIQLHKALASPQNPLPNPTLGGANPPKEFTA